MKEIIQIVKSFTNQQWLNIVFACVLLFGYQNYSERVKILENDLKIVREIKDKYFNLYNDCITKNHK